MKVKSSSGVIMKKAFLLRFRKEIQYLAKQILQNCLCKFVSKNNIRLKYFQSHASKKNGRNHKEILLLFFLKPHRNSRIFIKLSTRVYYTKFKFIIKVQYSSIYITLSHQEMASNTKTISILLSKPRSNKLIFSKFYT